MEPGAALERFLRRGVFCSMLLGFPMYILLSFDGKWAPLSTLTRSEERMAEVNTRDSMGTAGFQAREAP